VLPPPPFPPSPPPQHTHTHTHTQSYDEVNIYLPLQLLEAAVTSPEVGGGGEGGGEGVNGGGAPGRTNTGRHSDVSMEMRPSLQRAQIFVGIYPRRVCLGVRIGLQALHTNTVFSTKTTQTNTLLIQGVPWCAHRSACPTN
jgi:hypothetical protein